MLLSHTVGRHQHREQLNYLPHLTNAAACTDDLIVVAESACLTLHMHSWSGARLAAVDLTQLLAAGLEEREHTVYAVCGGDSGRLYVATGTSDDDNTYVTALHALQVTTLYHYSVCQQITSTSITGDYVKELFNSSMFLYLSNIVDDVYLYIKCIRTFISNCSLQIFDCYYYSSCMN